MLMKMTRPLFLAITLWGCNEANTDLTIAQGYTPTPPLTSKETQVLFDSLNPRVTWGVTQCFKRAHVWAHDLSILRNINPKLAEAHPEIQSKYNALRSSLHSRGINGINSMKVFIMFTNRLQMECDDAKDCKWFFHVAPYVMSDGEETVIDRTLFNSPLPINTWAKNLTTMGYEKHTGRKVEKCRVIESYTQYDNANDLYRKTLGSVTESLKEYLKDESATSTRPDKQGFSLKFWKSSVAMRIQRHEFSNDYLKSLNVPDSIIAEYDSILKIDLCQLRKVPMYYYDPRSIEFTDKSLAATRTTWVEQDLEYSYDEFKEGLDEY